LNSFNVEKKEEKTNVINSEICYTYIDVKYMKLILLTSFLLCILKVPHIELWIFKMRQVLSNG